MQFISCHLLISGRLSISSLMVSCPGQWLQDGHRYRSQWLIPDVQGRIWRSEGIRRLIDYQHLSDAPLQSPPVPGDFRPVTGSFLLTHCLNLATSLPRCCLTLAANPLPHSRYSLPHCCIAPALLLPDPLIDRSHSALCTTQLQLLWSYNLCLSMFAAAFSVCE